MTRTERLLRLARQRGDLVAVATLETALRNAANRAMRTGYWQRATDMLGWTEAELREAWGR